MFRFFCDISNDKFVFTNDDEHKIRNVLRLELGDQVEIVWNHQVFLCKIVQFIPHVEVSFVKILNEYNELNCYIRLIYCVPKGNDKLDMVIQKCTELGVKQFYLLNSERSIGKIKEDKVLAKILRLQRIIGESCKQCKRSEPPLVLGVLNSIEEIKTMNISKYSYICYEEDKTSEKIQILEDAPNFIGNLVTIIVGPEGGFSKKEVDWALRNGFKSTSLGRRILRSETAAIAATTIVSMFTN